MLFLLGLLLTSAIVIFIPLAICISLVWQRLGRVVADLLMSRKRRRVMKLGRSIDGSVRKLEHLPDPPSRGYEKYLVIAENVTTRLVFGAPAALAVMLLIIVGSITGAVMSGDDGPTQRNDVVRNPRSFVNDPFDDDGYYDDGYYDDGYYDGDGGFDSCVGDCTDMDNDGRTWNDVDADGDGLYETP